MRKKILFLSTMAVSFAALISPQVFAYTKIGYKLSGGVKDRYYYVGTSTLSSNIDSAVSNWNNIDPLSGWFADKTDVNFTRSTSNSATQIDFYSSDYGNTGWAGFTYYFNASGADNPGGYPTQDYTWSQIKLNTYYTNKSSWTVIAGHEMGHALGLKHYPSSLMDENIANMSGAPSGITQDDIDGIRDIY